MTTQIRNLLVTSLAISYFGLTIFSICEAFLQNQKRRNIVVSLKRSRWLNSYHASKLQAPGCPYPPMQLAVNYNLEFHIKLNQECTQIL